MRAFFNILALGVFIHIGSDAMEYQPFSNCPDEVLFLVLKPVIISDFLSQKPNSRVKYVCKKWGLLFTQDIINKMLAIYRTMSISQEDLLDPMIALSLKNNPCVTHLTIHNDFDPSDLVRSQIFRTIVLEGLQNKTLLKTLILTGDLNLDLFLQQNGETINVIDEDDQCIDEETVLGLPHMCCFTSLTELSIKGITSSDKLIDHYFYYLILNEEKRLPNLITFSSTDKNYPSFDRSNTVSLSLEQQLLPVSTDQTKEVIFDGM